MLRIGGIMRGIVRNDRLTIGVIYYRLISDSSE